MSYFKTTTKVLFIFALFIGACAFSLDYFLAGSGYDPMSALNRTVLGEELQAICIIMFWFVLFLVPEWNLS